MFARAVPLLRACHLVTEERRRHAAQGYLPGQLYNLDSKFGNKEQLQELNMALVEAGIRPIADIVVNHRCADQQDENGIWNKFR